MRISYVIIGILSLNMRQDIVKLQGHGECHSIKFVQAKARNHFC